MKNALTLASALLGLVALGSPAFASPLQLTDAQLDGITAGTATITVTDSAGALLGLVNAGSLAFALQAGPLNVAIGEGAAYGLGIAPTSTISVTGSGDMVITRTKTGGGQFISFSGGAGVSLSFGK